MRTSRTVPAVLKKTRHKSSTRRNATECQGFFSSQEERCQNFNFEIVDGYKIEDPVGLDCKSEDQAREVAASIARQIAIDVGTEAARSVSLVDEQGSEVHKVPVKS